MEIEVVDIKGNKTGRLANLNEKVFNLEPNNEIVHATVKAYLANQRQGTHKTKERGDIKSSTRKIRKQKGTGAARAGSIKNPLFRGGGTVFGPRPRDYRLKINKKIRIKSKYIAFSDKFRNNKIIIIEDFQISQPKTKSYLNILQSLNIEKEKTLLIIPNVNTNIHLSSRNILKANLATISDVNTYSILNSNFLIFSEEAIKIANSYA